jgi:hypothetical protein
MGLVAEPGQQKAIGLGIARRRTIAHYQAMTLWQHAHLIVIFEGEHTEETGWIFKRQFQVQDWTVHWAGPEGVGQNTRSGLAGTPVQVLNELGADGWEVAAAFHDENRYEYVLKRDVG